MSEYGKDDNINRNESANLNDDNLKDTNLDNTDGNEVGNSSSEGLNQDASNISDISKEADKTTESKGTAAEGILGDIKDTASKINLQDGIKSAKDNFKNVKENFTLDEQNREGLKEGVNILAKNLKNKKGRNIAIAVGVGILVIIIAIVLFLNRSISLEDKVEVKFSGYNGSGVLDYNREEIDQIIEKEALKEAGFSNKDAERLAGNLDNLSLDQSLAGTPEEFANARRLKDTVQYAFSKEENLKNGEKVKFTVKCYSDDLPFKDGEKEFKVKGLEKVKGIKIKDLLKKNKIEFVGFDGIGKIKFSDQEVDEDDDDYYEDGNEVFVIKDYDRQGKLKNGDKVTLSIRDSYVNDLQDSGKTVDKKTIKVTVKGLKKLNELKGLDALIEANDTSIRADYENTEYMTYNIEKMENFIKYDSNAEYGTVSMLTIYKITSKGSSSDARVEYNTCSQEAYILSDGSIDFDTKSSDDNYGSTKDKENLLAKLKKDGYIMYENNKAEAQ
ncbi:MAG: hypothetical protein PUK14_02825 [Clostridiales bacterium]|nr:hypothetical protein [Clostridiales bacterium]